MNPPNLHKMVFVTLALLCVTMVNGFVHARPLKISSSLVATRAAETKTTKTSPLKADTADVEFDIKDTYKQGEVPLFAVVNATMRASSLCYTLADVKNDIRKNEDKWIDGDVMLRESVIFEEEIGDFVKKNEDRIEEKGFEKMKDYQLGLKGDNRIRCMDAQFSNKELVYGINVNRSRKQVTVIFRGSATLRDWMADLDLRKYPCTDGDVTYELHNGFRRYLNSETKVEGDGDLTKLEQITEELEKVMENGCKGFDVFVTGHSLGGALATLYGFRLAQTKKFPMVNVVTYASPYVGTEGFRKVFRQLEADGFLRHIRVSNPGDCVPAAARIRGFSHVGVNLELRKSGPKMHYKGKENPALPVAYLTALASFASVSVKFLSIFIKALSKVPTIPVGPSAILLGLAAKNLYDNHMFVVHRKRFAMGFEQGEESYTKTIEELYVDRLKSIARHGA